MTASDFSKKAVKYLHQLCVDIPDRRVGSAGNQAATRWFGETAAAFGFAVEGQEFACMDWTQEGASLSAGGVPFDVQVSPYSPGAQVQAPLTAASTLEDLQAVEAAGKILLLQGDLTGEQLMPKNFPFYNPEEHRRIIALLEAKQPAAIAAATARNPEMAGAVYPFPLIEDGDFDIPSVFMTEEEGARLAARTGETVTLDLRAQRKPARGLNVIARKGGSPQRRAVLFAHIDAKMGTPGAIDNASGVTILLLLAEMLAQFSGALNVEIAALNGEDYYSNPGEQEYLQRNAGRFEEIVLGINLDGVGYRRGATAYSTYDCPPELAGMIRQAFERYPGLTEGEPWYQGDHGLFLINRRPALAVTSENVIELMTRVVHTERDRPEIVDPVKLVYTAQALRDLLLQLDQM